jgi:hypothetical protein
LPPEKEHLELEPISTAAADPILFPISIFRFFYPLEMAWTEFLITFLWPQAMENGIPIARVNSNPKRKLFSFQKSRPPTFMTSSLKAKSYQEPKGKKVMNVWVLRR